MRRGKIRIRKYILRPFTIGMAPELRRSDFRSILNLIFLATVWCLGYQDILIMRDFTFAGRRAVSRRLGLPLYLRGVRFCY